MPNHKYGILLQGRVSLWLKDIITEYKSNFPEAHIVLSTWNTEDVSKIDCDIIQSELPVSTYPHSNTTNHQIIGVNAGLKKINAEIILKCRTDQFIHNKKIFELFNDNCPLDKIMIPDLGTTLDDDYRASDFCQLATSKILNKFWNNITFYDGKYAISPEIYLAKNYVVNFMKNTKPWNKIMNEYFHIMKYHSDFQIEFEKLTNDERYVNLLTVNHIEQIKNHNKKFRVKSHFFQSQKSRIKFSKKYVGEKVLLCTYGINTQYASSKSILNSNCNEIWNRKNFEEDLTQRKLNSENDIEFEKEVNFENISENSFDSILSFEEIQFHNDPDLLLKTYKKLLKPNGVLIISSSSNSNKISDSEEEVNFEKQKLLKIIKSNFTIIDEYYQGNISENKKFNQSSIKVSLKKILDKFDKRMIFYKLYLQPKVTKQREKNYEKNRIDFTPKILDSDQTGLYFLIIVKGNR
jgi:hypothetical protein